jgi:hypothetical protein
MANSKGSSLPGVTSLSSLRQLESLDPKGRNGEQDSSNRPHDLIHNRASSKKRLNVDLQRSRLQVESELGPEEHSGYEGSHGAAHEHEHLDGKSQQRAVRLKAKQQRPGSQKRQWDPYCDSGSRGVKRNESFAVLQGAQEVYPSAYRGKERDNPLKRSKSIVALHARVDLPPELSDDCPPDQPRRTIEKTKSVRAFPKRGHDKASVPHSGQGQGQGHGAGNRSVIERNLRLPSLSDEKKIPQSKRPRALYGGNQLDTPYN